MFDDYADIVRNQKIEDAKISSRVFSMLRRQEDSIDAQRTQHQSNKQRQREQDRRSTVRTRLRLPRKR